MKTKLIAAMLAIVCLCLLVACDRNSAGETPEGEPYSFIVDGVTFTPGGSASSVFAVWRGEAPKISVKASCLGGVDGEDVNYVYSGFYIQTFRETANDPNEQIRWVVLTDDSVETAKGITIGATAQAVKDTYGEAKTETASLLLYESGGTHLRFELRDGEVKKISYSVAE